MMFERWRNEFGDRAEIDLASLPEGWRSSNRPLVAVVSSRLGTRVRTHVELGRQLRASAREARRTNAIWLTVLGTAIEPWLSQAAELFQVNVCRLQVAGKTNLATSRDRDHRFPPILVTPRVGVAVDRDELAIALADRVEVVHLRGGGTIERWASERLNREPASVRIALGDEAGDAGAAVRLLDAGAVGRYLPPRRRESIANVADECVPLTTIAPEEGWLTHCTRARLGPWPGQTLRQYRDECLIGGCNADHREPIDSLCRIVRSRRLVAGAIASRHVTPVVCFAEVDPVSLITRRTFRSHLKRWDYEPYGIAIRLAAAERMGIRRVIYRDPKSTELIPVAERFRITSPGRTHDWTTEREWRHAGDLDLSTLGADDVRLFVPDHSSAVRVQRTNSGNWPIAIVQPSTTHVSTL